MNDQFRFQGNEFHFDHVLPQITGDESLVKLILFECVYKSQHKNNRQNNLGIN